MEMSNIQKTYDEEAFQEIVLQYSKLLYTVSLSILGKQANRDDVEEIVSDVFLRFWQHPEKFNPEKSSLKTYLVIMTKSVALNKVKKHHRDFDRMTEFPLEELSEEVKNREDIWRIFFNALMILEEPTREICFERFFHEVKPRKIAKNLHLPLKEVNNRLYKGKKKIQKEMEYALFLEEMEEER